MCDTLCSILGSRGKLGNTLFSSTEIQRFLTAGTQLAVLVWSQKLSREAPDTPGRPGSSHLILVTSP